MNAHVDPQSTVTEQNITNENPQNCPLKLCFALLLQPVLLKVQDVQGLSLNAWYLDDGNLVGSRAALQESWDILVQEGEPRGLFISLDKSLVTIKESEKGRPRESLLSRDPLDRGFKVP